MELRDIEALKLENQVQKSQLENYEDDFKHEREDRTRAVQERLKIEDEFDAYKNANAIQMAQLNKHVEELSLQLIEKDEVIQWFEGHNKKGVKTALENHERMKMENKALSMRVAELERQLDARKKQQKLYQIQNDSLRRGFNSLQKNVNSTEDIMQVVIKKLDVQLNATTIELEAAKEEIAVKVAQVKQYQKQVEAYKQQLEQSNQQSEAYKQQLDYMSLRKEETEKQLQKMIDSDQSIMTVLSDTHVGGPTHPQSTHAGPLPDPPSTYAGYLLLTSSEEDRAAGGQGIIQGTALVPSSNSAPGTVQGIILPPTSNPPSSDVKTPQLPSSDSPVQCKEPGAASSSYHVPDACTPAPLAGQPDSDDLPPPLRPPGAVSPLLHGPYQEEYRRSAHFVVPPDPNLTCPYCHIVFKKGEIQLFKQHVQECKHS